MTDKLLIADDDIFVLKTIQNTLSEKEKENIHFCESPEEAIELISQNQYARVISDWRFPCSDLTGVDILACAKENGIEERVLMTSISKIKGIDDADTFCGVRKPLSKNTVKVICFEDYENLMQMNCIIR
jgi:DNA-binding NtrC family response regulator